MPLAKYQNGNTTVTLEEDGTKTREWDSIAKPEFPESVDLKITDYCDLGCSYCHECSTPQGKHADVETIRKVISGLPAGVELAIGGGNPLAHPRLEDILRMIKDRGLIGNITINARHIPKYSGALLFLRSYELVHGVGMSYHQDAYDDIIYNNTRNTVIHMIAGETNIKALKKFTDYGYKVLVLGYKQYGRGKAHYSEDVKNNLSKWRYWIGDIIHRSKSIISFDNLAIKQLNVRGVIGIDDWDKCYMGDDGQFTMYVDAVNDKYAVSSINERKPLNGMTIKEAFRNL